MRAQTYKPKYEYHTWDMYANHTHNQNTELPMFEESDPKLWSEIELQLLFLNLFQMFMGSI